MSILKSVHDFFFPNRVSTNEWLGEYRYGEMYNEAQQGNIDEFKIYLDFDGQQVSGNLCVLVNDMPKSYPIDGVFDGVNIFFNENRPERLTLLKDGSTHIEDMLSEIVTYKGIFNPKTNSFAGDWELITFIQPYSNAVAEKFIWAGRWRIFKK
jgi:hypothetical protein